MKRVFKRSNILLASSASLFFVAASLSSITYAQEEKATETAATPVSASSSYEGTAELSSLITNGNTKNQTTGLGLELTYKPDPWLVKGKAQYLTTISNDIQTQESLEMSGRAGRKLSEIFDLFLQQEYLKNRYTGIEDRYISSAGVGYNIFKNDEHNFKTELLLGYTDEERSDATHPAFMSGGAAIFYKWQMTKTSDFSHETRYQPNFSNSEDWRLVSETALSSAISSFLSSKISWKYEHLNLPPAGKLKGDTTTMVSLLAKF